MTEVLDPRPWRYEITAVGHAASREEAERHAYGGKVEYAPRPNHETAFSAGHSDGWHGKPLRDIPEFPQYLKGYKAGTESRARMDDSIADTQEDEDLL